MCQEPVDFDAAKDEFRCQCRPAVLNAYCGLKAAGQPERVALEAAQRVYRFHHPEDAKDAAALTVERWVNAGSMH